MKHRNPNTQRSTVLPQGALFRVAVRTYLFVGSFALFAGLSLGYMSNWH